MGPLYACALLALALAAAIPAAHAQAHFGTAEVTLARDETAVWNFFPLCGNDAAYRSDSQTSIDRQNNMLHVTVDYPARGGGIQTVPAEELHAVIESADPALGSVGFINPPFTDHGNGTATAHIPLSDFVLDDYIDGDLWLKFVNTDAGDFRATTYDQIAKANTYLIDSEADTDACTLGSVGPTFYDSPDDLYNGQTVERPLGLSLSHFCHLRGDVWTLAPDEEYFLNDHLRDDLLRCEYGRTSSAVINLQDEPYQFAEIPDFVLDEDDDPVTVDFGDYLHSFDGRPVSVTIVGGRGPAGTNDGGEKVLDITIRNNGPYGVFVLDPEPNKSLPERTISMRVVDSSGARLLPNPEMRIGINPVNDPPELTGGGTYSLDGVEGGTEVSDDATVIDLGSVYTDIDDRDSDLEYSAHPPSGDPSLGSVTYTLAGDLLSISRVPHAHTGAGTESITITPNDGEDDGEQYTVEIDIDPLPKTYTRLASQLTVTEDSRIDIEPDNLVDTDACTEYAWANSTISGDGWSARTLDADPCKLRLVPDPDHDTDINMVLFLTPAATPSDDSDDEAVFFTLDVEPVGDRPKFSDQSVIVAFVFQRDVPVNHTLAVYDPDTADADLPLYCSTPNVMPTGLTLNTDCTITGTPTVTTEDEQFGLQSIIIYVDTVGDEAVNGGRADDSLKSHRIHVVTEAVTNTSPELVGAAGHRIEGNEDEFVPGTLDLTTIFRDADGDTLTYRVQEGVSVVRHQISGNELRMVRNPNAHTGDGTETMVLSAQDQYLGLAPFYRITFDIEPVADELEQTVSSIRIVEDSSRTVSPGDFVSGAFCADYVWADAASSGEQHTGMRGADPCEFTITPREDVDRSFLMELRATPAGTPSDGSDDVTLNFRVNIDDIGDAPKFREIQDPAELLFLRGIEANYSLPVYDPDTDDALRDIECTLAGTLPAGLAWAGDCRIHGVPTTATSSPAEITVSADTQGDSAQGGSDGATEYDYAVEVMDGDFGHFGDADLSLVNTPDSQSVFHPLCSNHGTHRADIESWFDTAAERFYISADSPHPDAESVIFSFVDPPPDGTWDTAIGTTAVHPNGTLTSYIPLDEFNRDVYVGRDIAVAFMDDDATVLSGRHTFSTRATGELGFLFYDNPGDVYRGGTFDRELETGAADPSVLRASGTANIWVVGDPVFSVEPPVRCELGMSSAPALTIPDDPIYYNELPDGVVGQGGSFPEVDFDDHFLHVTDLPLTITFDPELDAAGGSVLTFDYDAATKVLTADVAPSSLLAPANITVIATADRSGVELETRVDWEIGVIANAPPVPDPAAWPVTGNEDEFVPGTLDLDDIFTDPNGDDIEYTPSPQSSDPSLSVITYRLTGSTLEMARVPNAHTGTGTETLTITPNDGTVDGTPLVITFTIAPVDDPVVQTVSALAVDEDSYVDITPSGVASDADYEGDYCTDLAWGSTNRGNEWRGEVLDDGCTYRISPVADYDRDFAMSLTLGPAGTPSDPSDDATLAFAVDVSPVGDAPKFGGPSEFVIVRDADAEYVIDAYDPDTADAGRAITCGTASTLPDGLALHANCTITGTATADATAELNVTADTDGDTAVNGGDAGASWRVYTMTVRTNSPPSLSGDAGTTISGDENAFAADPIKLDEIFEDADGDRITYSAAPASGDPALSVVRYSIRGDTLSFMRVGNANTGSGEETLVITPSDGIAEGPAYTVTFDIEPVDNPTFPQIPTGIADADDGQPGFAPLCSDDGGAPPLSAAGFVDDRFAVTFDPPAAYGSAVFLFESADGLDVLGAFNGTDVLDAQGRIESSSISFVDYNRVSGAADLKVVVLNVSETVQTAGLYSTASSGTPLYHYNGVTLAGMPVRLGLPDAAAGTTFSAATTDFDADTVYLPDSTTPAVAAGRFTVGLVEEVLCTAGRATLSGSTTIHDRDGDYVPPGSYAVRGLGTFMLNTTTVPTIVYPDPPVLFGMTEDVVFTPTIDDPANYLSALDIQWYLTVDGGARIDPVAEGRGELLEEGGILIYDGYLLGDGTGKNLLIEVSNSHATAQADYDFEIELPLSCDLEIVPSSVSFGNVRVRSTSAPVEQSITNSGGQSVTEFDMSISDWKTMSGNLRVIGSNATEVSFDSSTWHDLQSNIDEGDHPGLAVAGDGTVSLEYRLNLADVGNSDVGATGASDQLLESMYSCDPVPGG